MTKKKTPTTTSAQTPAPAITPKPASEAPATNAIKDLRAIASEHEDRIHALESAAGII